MSLTRLDIMLIMLQSCMFVYLGCERQHWRRGAGPHAQGAVHHGWGGVGLRGKGMSKLSNTWGFNLPRSNTQFQILPIIVCLMSGCKLVSAGDSQRVWRGRGHGSHQEGVHQTRHEECLHQEHSLTDTPCLDYLHVSVCIFVCSYHKTLSCHDHYSRSNLQSITAPNSVAASRLRLSGPNSSELILPHRALPGQMSTLTSSLETDVLFINLFWRSWPGCNPGLWQCCHQHPQQCT